MITAEEVKALSDQQRTNLINNLKSPKVMESYLIDKGIAKSGKINSTFPCPICGHGQDTPCASYRDGFLTCYSTQHTGNRNSYDFIGLIEATQKHTGDFNETLAAACNAADISFAGFNNNAVSQARTEATKPHRDQAYSNHDYSEYVMKCKKNLSDEDCLSFLANRGFTDLSFLQQNGIGYDPEKKAVVLPYNKEGTYYITRSIESKRYYKLGPEILFHGSNLYQSDQSVFVTEGQFNALAIEAAGGKAIALGSTNNSMKLLQEIDDHGKPTAPLLIIAFDNDYVTPAESEKEYTNEELTAKGKATDEKAISLVNELTSRGVNAVRVPQLYQNYNDANDFYKSNPTGFAAAINAAETTKSEQNHVKEDYVNENSAAGSINDFTNALKTMAKTPAIETGFNSLDGALDGGLYAGLYILGAITSIGKTTLIMQIADQIAKHGTDVIIFSLEMSKYELIARSISRESFINDKDNALTTRDILDANRWKAFITKKSSNMNEAQNGYKAYADHVFIVEGIGDVTVDTIREKVNQHKLIMNTSPVVIVDYVQLLQPLNEHMTDKQNTDKNVMELKRISRDYNTPIIGISSLNRAAYNAAVTLEAFKESGAIEYSCDVLMGLNKEKKEKEEDTYKVMKLELLKHRNGRSGVKTTFDYYPAYNYFRDHNGIDLPKSNTKRV